MRGIVLRPFNYAVNGIRIVFMTIGAEFDFDEVSSPGLVREGYIRPAGEPLEPVSGGAPAIALAQPPEKPVQELPGGSGTGDKAPIPRAKRR